MACVLQESDFCVAPLGQVGGDPDRYVPSVLFGCIPVLLSSAHKDEHALTQMALPLEEVLPWHLFGTVVDVKHLDKLGAQIDCLRPIVPRLRANMAKRWRNLLYGGMYGRSYLGEGTRADAFEGIMRVLKQRAAHSYAAPPAVRFRMENRKMFFPCMQPSPNMTVYAHWVENMRRVPLDA